MRPCGHHHYYKYAHAKNKDDLLAVHNSSSTYKDDQIENIWGPFSLESLEKMGSGYFNHKTMKKWIGYIPNTTQLTWMFYTDSLQSTALEEVDFQGIQPEKITEASSLFRSCSSLKKIPESMPFWNIKSFGGMFMSGGAKSLILDDSEDGIPTFPYMENFDNATNIESVFSWAKFDNWLYWKMDDKYSFKNATVAFNTWGWWSYFYKFPDNLSFKNVSNGNSTFTSGGLNIKDAYSQEEIIFAPKDIMSNFTDGTSMFSSCHLTKFYPNFESYSFPKLTTAAGMFSSCSLDAESIIKFCNALPKWTSGTHKVTIGANPDVKYDPYVNLALKQVDINFEPFVELPIDENTGLPTEVTEGKGWTLTFSFPADTYRAFCTDKEVLPPDLLNTIKNDTANLPENYTRCLYLKSNSGGQYIDTGFTPNANTGLYVIAKNSVLSSLSQPQVMSNWYGESNCRISAPVVAATRYFNPIYYWNGQYKDYSYQSYSIPGRSYEGWLNWLNSSKIKTNVDGLIYETTLETHNNAAVNRNIEIFRGSNNSSFYQWNGKVYRAKISDGDTIVRDFVPALDPNGIPCMFDIINQQPYYNAQESDFVFDSENITVNDGINLPENYTRLDYLETIGFNVIDTEVKPNYETGINITFSLELGIRNAPIAGTYGNYINSPNGGGNWNIGTFIPPYPTNYTNRVKTNFMNTKAGVKVTKGESIVTLPFSFNKTDTFVSSLNFYNNKKAYINETLVWDIPENLPRNPETKNIYLFGINRENYYWKNECFIGRIYRAQITQGSELIRDFIPCLDPNGKPCMYDIVNDKPYYSMNNGFEYEIANFN